MPHLFVDISAHGFGHLAQAAPVLDRLHERLPGLRLTLRCGLPEDKLRQRIGAPFTHLPAASDFGYAMIDAVTIDHAATAAAYRTAHADFSRRVADEASLLRKLQIDAVFSDVAYLPLAGAAQADIPATALCSLNWADLFRHFYGHEPWAAPVHAEMLASYRSATFLRTTPAMPMPSLERQLMIGPIAQLGRDHRSALRQKVGTGETARLGLIALGGIPFRLPVEHWPMRPNTHWLVPAHWNVERPDMHAIESLPPLNRTFADLLRSVDVVVTKPGYGTFTEAACNGTAVLYLRRTDWPEQDCLLEWLQQHARCAEIGSDALMSGRLGDALDACLAKERPPLPEPTGIGDAADVLIRSLS